MSYIIRKIRKSKWYKNQNVFWLSEGELQADALSDFSTKDNKLSVWVVNNDKSNLHQIIAALTSKADRISNFDYVLLEENHLQLLGIKQIPTKGETHDSKANDTCHIDLVELTAEKLFKLVKIAYEHGTIDRIMNKEVKRIVSSSLERGNIDISSLSNTLQEQLKN